MILGRVAYGRLRLKLYTNLMIMIIDVYGHSAGLSQGAGVAMVGDMEGDEPWYGPVWIRRSLWNGDWMKGIVEA